MTQTISEPTENAPDRKATWLELFFDLIFVVAIAKASHILFHVHDNHLSSEMYLKYILVMIPIWWAWTGCTVFTNRFDCDDVLQRLMSFAQMFCLIILAAFINTDFDSYYHGFLFSYAAIRLFTVLMYVRASINNEQTRHVSHFLALCFGGGILISLSSLFFEGTLRYIALYAGILFEMIMPLMAKKRLKTVPVNSHHLPERFGLLTIILLGESILSLSNSFETISWQFSSITMAFCSFVMVCGLWWIYFETIDHSILGKKLGNGQSIIYSHLLIYAGLGGIAAMIRFAVIPELNLIDYKILTAFSIFSFIFALQFLQIVYSTKENRKYLLMNIILFNILFITLLIFSPSITVIMVGITILITIYVSTNYRKNLRLK